MSSESIYQIKIDFLGTEKIVEGEIERVKAPRLIQKLINKSPFNAMAKKNFGNPKSYWMILTDIKRGMEAVEYKDYHKGDIVYCPRQDALFFIFEDNPPISLPVFFVGNITSGIEHLEELRRSMNTKLEMIDITKKE